MSIDEPSYIDYEVFLDPSFSAVSFANKLVLATNEPSDNPQDLSTPLQKVLFDVQEIDTHIDTLTTKAALPLLQYTQVRAQTSQRILDETESQITSLTDAYNVLQREVVERYEAAEQVKIVAERLFQTIRLARGVSRTLLLGRQLEAQMTEYAGSGAKKVADHRAMVRAANSIASVKYIMSANKVGQEGHGLDRVAAITTLRKDLITPAEKVILSRSQQIIREFSISSLVISNVVSQQSTGAAPTYTQNEETKSKTTCALFSLYLLSPLPAGSTATSFEASYVNTVLQEYLQTALKASLAALARSLATLPTLDRALTETSARCQNILALESLLASLRPPAHPAFDDSLSDDDNNDNDPAKGTHQIQARDDDGDAASVPSQTLLDQLLASLDTASLSSFFWRSLASALSPRVQDILAKGGVSARTLRSSKDKVREAVRSCVDRGNQLPAAMGRRSGDSRSWEREAAVMVAAIVGPLSR